MFELTKTGINNKVFNLKRTYLPEEAFEYELQLYNHITKTGFTITCTDISPWVSGVTNTSILITGTTTIFYTGNTNYLNAFSNYTFIFNNIIQVSGVNHTFTANTGITNTESCILNGNYVVIYNDGVGKLTLIDSTGGTITTKLLSLNPISNLNIHPVGTTKVVVGYYDEGDMMTPGMSFVKEIDIVGTQITQYQPTAFYVGEAKQTKINKISDTEFVITYQTNTQGIIQVVSLGIDHIFSVKYPFVFNNGLTLFSNSVYQNGNVVVIFYDTLNQLQIRNCTLYDDYIGVGNTTIIAAKYCYDLNVEKLDNNYVYVGYYNGEDLVLTTEIVKINTDSIIVGNSVSFEDWNEGLELVTITPQEYILVYMDNTFEGVYKQVQVSGGTMDEIVVEYNEFDIDITAVDITRNIGHNDYWFKYQNVVVEKGVCKITNT